MAGRPKGGPKFGGRKKGTPNKITSEVRDLVRQALEVAHPNGPVAYLKWAAKAQPAAFLTLLGKTIPSEIRAEIAGGATITLHVERSFVKELPEPGRAVALGGATVQVIGTGRG